MAIRKRKKSRRNRRGKRVSFGVRLKRVVLIAVKIVLVLAAVPALAYGGLKAHHELFTSPYLEIKKIEVAGARRTKSDELIRLAEIQTGYNILSVEILETAKKIEAHPWVSSAEVSRTMPDTVSIEVTEREPALLVKMDGLYVADKLGVIFKRYSPEDSLDLPVITGLEKVDGERPGRLEAGLLSFVAALAAREGFNLDSVSEIHVDGSRVTTLYTIKRGVRVELGRDGDMEASLAKLERVMSARGGTLRGVKVVELSNDRGVVLRLAGRNIKKGGVRRNGKKG